MDNAKVKALLAQVQAGLDGLTAELFPVVVAPAPAPAPAPVVTPTPAPAPAPAPTPKPVGRVPENPTGLKPGLKFKYYQAASTYETMPNFVTEKVVKSGVAPTPDLSQSQRPDNFAFVYTGYVYAPADGPYTFFTKSDDGSRLWIGDTRVVENNAVQAPTERSGTITLLKGWHAITVEFFEFNNTQELSVSYAGPGIAKQVIPASAYGYVDLISNVTATLRNG